MVSSSQPTDADKITHAHTFSLQQHEQPPNRCHTNPQTQPVEERVSSYKTKPVSGDSTLYECGPERDDSIMLSVIVSLGEVMANRPLQHDLPNAISCML